MESKQLLLEFEVPKYIRTYVVSNNVREKYFIKGGKKLPLVFCDKRRHELEGVNEPDGINYAWRPFPRIRQKQKVLEDFLVDLKTDLRVIANPKEVGKQKRANINGQSIYNGNIQQHQRNNMIGAIKDFLRPFIHQLQTINKYPIRIDYYVFDVIYDRVYSNNLMWDIENRMMPYTKCFHDLLTELETEEGGFVPRRLYKQKEHGKIIRDCIITDDNILYVTEPAHPIFVPIENPNEAKIIFRIFKDNRRVILNDPDYQEIHGDKLNG